MFILLQTLILIKLNSADKDTMPVFLMDFNNVMGDIVDNRNPFAKTPSDYFSEILHDCIKRCDVIIIFVEDTFSIEDVTMKDHHGSPYENLRMRFHDNEVKLFSKVTDSYAVISKIFKREIFNTFNLNANTKLDDLFADHFNDYFIFKYFYVFFDDELNEPRVETLRRHDLLIKEVSQIICKLTAGAVIALYTGMVNPVHVEQEPKKLEKVGEPCLQGSCSRSASSQQELPPSSRDVGVMIETEVALFRFVGMSKLSMTRRSSFDVVPMDVIDTWNDERLATKLAYGEFELEFDFGFKEDSWLLDMVILLEGGTEVGRTIMGIGAPLAWSYYCGEPLIVVNKRDGGSIVIMKYQIQPFPPPRVVKKMGYENVTSSPLLLSRNRREDENNATDGASSDDENDTDSDENTSDSDENNNKHESKCFGNTVNCGPYFNTHILSGLMVSAICFGPLAFGIYFLYNCKPQDKYEPFRYRLLLVAPECCECCKCALEWYHTPECCECCKCALEWCQCFRESCECNIEIESRQFVANERCKYHRLFTD